MDASDFSIDDEVIVSFNSEEYRGFILDIDQVGDFLEIELSRSVGAMQFRLSEVEISIGWENDENWLVAFEEEGK